MSLGNLGVVLRARAPIINNTLKALIDPWRTSSTPIIPAVKRFRGFWAFVHPQFLTMDLNHYEPHVLDWLAASIKPGDCVLDIGANMGLLSLLMAKLCGSAGSVYAFEPSPALCGRIEYHKRKNRLHQLRVQPLAVSDKHGETISFYLLGDGKDSRNSLVFSGEKADNFDQPLYASRKEIHVQTATVDAFCNENGCKPTLLKIDVEGAELLVLRGALHILAELKPRIVLAVHPWWLPAGQTTADIVSLLQSLGYVIKDLSGQEVEVLEYGEYLCLPR